MKEFTREDIQEMIAKKDVEGLILALESEPAQAAAGLGEIGDRRAIEPLIALLKTKKYGRARRVIPNVLRQIGDEWAVVPLAEALDDEDDELRLEAAEILIEIGDERAVDGLKRALDDRNPAVRQKAATALRKIESLETLESLIRELESSDAVVRWKAAEALVQIGGEKAVEPLVKALKDKNSDVREVAARSLGTIGDVRAVESLIMTLTDNNSDVRTSAATALGRIGDERAVDALIKALNDQDAQVRWQAAEALGNIGDERATKPLRQALNDPIVGVRGKAKEALAKIRSKSVGGLQTSHAIKQFLAEPGTIRVMAITSLVLSIAALPASVTGVGLLFPFLAVILGLISYVQARKNESPRNIRRMALAGMILGGLLIILLFMIMVGAWLWQNF